MIPEAESKPGSLTSEDRQLLLELARHALQTGVCGEPLPPLDLQSLPPALREPGATFVTLTSRGDLRGCIGALEARLPLAEDVREHAIAAALHDYRFPHVTPEELKDIHIEISRLTPSRPLDYTNPEALPNQIRPHIDGVVLKDGFRRATFLPQVWEKISDPCLFLGNLCQKMGSPTDLWRWKILEVWTYQVEEFHE